MLPRLIFNIYKANLLCRIIYYKLLCINNYCTFTNNYAPTSPHNIDLDFGGEEGGIKFYPSIMTFSFTFAKIGNVQTWIQLRA
jgi:hypothetical protein